MTISPEGRRQMDELAAQRGNPWDGTRPHLFDSRLGARTVGSLALVEPGNSVFTDPEKKRNAHDEPM